MKKFLLTLFIYAGLNAQAQLPLVFKGFDLNTGTGFSDPLNLAAYNNKLYFMANTPANGEELWVSDGTTAGTYMLKDINAGPLSSLPSGFTVVNGKLVFIAASVSDFELWVTDGTSAGTQMLKAFNPGSSSIVPTFGAVLSDKLIFSAQDSANGYELWITDGTIAGTSLLKDIYPGIYSSNPSDFIAYGGKAYFRATDTAGNYELWVTDGTAAGTHLFMDIEPGTLGSDPQNFSVVGSQLFFKAAYDTFGFELWVSDGTVSGTHMVKDIRPGVFSSTLWEIADYQGKAYFPTLDNVNGEELWVSDGTAAGTQMVKNINPGSGASGNSQPEQLTVYNNKLYFSANDGTNGKELWVTDGTAAGTQMVKDIFTGTSGSYPQYMTVYKKFMYFKGRGATNEDFLYRSDGTAAGTFVVAPPGSTQPDPLGDAESGFLMVDSILYFSAHFDNTGRELWAMEDTTTYPPGAGVAAANAKTYSIKPNPAKDVFTIEFYNALYGQATITISDNMGRVVASHTVSSGDVEINLSNYPAGTYMVTVQKGDHASVQKLVKH